MSHKKAESLKGCATSIVEKLRKQITTLEDRNKKMWVNVDEQTREFKSTLNGVINEVSQFKKSIDYQQNEILKCIYDMKKFNYIIILIIIFVSVPALFFLYQIANK